MGARAVTYDDFLILVSDKVAKEPQIRYGQMWYNELALHRADIAHQINGTPSDPFYRDTVDEEAHEFARSRW